jgi:hypothetical protein
MIATATEPSPPDQRSVGAVLSGLNHLSQWRGRTVVIKYGGAAMGRAELRASFARDVAGLRAAGVHPVIVHGGGPQIDTLMRRLGKRPRFVDGLRVTDDETLELVEMVLVGRINPELVGLINQHGGHAIGINGKNSDLIVAHRCRAGGGPAAPLRSGPWRHARPPGRRSRELRAGEGGREPGRAHVRGRGRGRDVGVWDGFDGCRVRLCAHRPNGPPGTRAAPRRRAGDRRARRLDDDARPRRVREAIRARVAAVASGRPPQLERLARWAGLVTVRILAPFVGESGDADRMRSGRATCQRRARPAVSGTRREPELLPFSTNSAGRAVTATRLRPTVPRRRPHSSSSIATRLRRLQKAMSANPMTPMAIWRTLRTPSSRTKSSTRASPPPARGRSRTGATTSVSSVPPRSHWTAGVDQGAVKLRAAAINARSKR